jgi:NAD(P)H-flavin reductase
MTFPGSVQNRYLPRSARVTLVTGETTGVETFRFELIPPEARIEFAPGQFVILSIVGLGECPISISSSPGDGPWLELTIRKVGRVTAALFRNPPKGVLGLRGPFGKGFDLATISRRPLICVAGGIGLAPLRSLIHYVHASRGNFGPLAILYGARTPRDRLYKDELGDWRVMPNDKVLQIVEEDPDGSWRGPRGLAMELIGQLGREFDGATAVLCGPGVMVGPVVKALEARGLAAEEIQVAMERRMSCGVGKCGHCYMGEKLVCVDGPVFTAQELRRLGEEI